MSEIRDQIEYLKRIKAKLPPPINEEKKRYNVIYVDPPWSYENKCVGRDGNHGADNKYSTMTNIDIIALPIRELAAKNCMCFLWATTPLMPIAFKVLEHWGFEYKTMLTWRKIMSLGMGYWFRGQTEHLLLGIRGTVKASGLQVPNFHQCKAGKHSQKPHWFREQVNAAAAASFKEPIKLELFARSRDGMFPDIEYEGWDVYGNEVNNSITLPTTA